MNRRRQRNNKTNCNGVSFHSTKGLFQVIISIDGKNYHHGYFKTFDEAVRHRVKVEEQVGWPEDTQARYRLRLMEQSYE